MALQASRHVADWPVAPPRFAPHLSMTHGDLATGDLGVSPDRTRTSRLPSACRSVTSQQPPRRHGAQAAGRTTEQHDRTPLFAARLAVPHARDRHPCTRSSCTPRAIAACRLRSCRRPKVGAKAVPCSIRARSGIADMALGSDHRTAEVLTTAEPSIAPRGVSRETQALITEIYAVRRKFNAAVMRRDQAAGRVAAPSMGERKPPRWLKAEHPPQWYREHIAREQRELHLGADRPRTLRQAARRDDGTFQAGVQKDAVERIEAMKASLNAPWTPPSVARDVIAAVDLRWSQTGTPPGAPEVHRTFGTRSRSTSINRRATSSAIAGSRSLERPQAGLPGAAADPGDRLAFLVGGVVADEPSDAKAMRPIRAIGAESGPCGGSRVCRSGIGRVQSGHFNDVPSGHRCRHAPTRNPRPSPPDAPSKALRWSRTMGSEMNNSSAWRPRRNDE